MPNNINDFFNNIYWDNELRIVGKRDLKKDKEHYLFNNSLIPKELELTEKYFSKKYPIIFIVGAPRSGTTLLSQVLANTFDIGFINNYISKHYMAPLMSLIEFQKKHKSDKIDYNSELGNTNSINSPHEFGYFWQYWMNFKDHDQPSNSELNQIDWVSIEKELFSISSYLQKPLLIKNINYVDYNILTFYKKLKNVKFIFIEREPEYVIQSCYLARLKRYNNPNIWFGVKPKNINEISKKDWLTQLIYQYKHLNSEMKKQMNKIGPNNCLSITYTDLTVNTDNTIEILSDFIGLKKIRENPILRNANSIKVSETIFKEIKINTLSHIEDK